MALLTWLRRVRRPSARSSGHAPRPQSESLGGSAPREDRLRAVLAENPNDAEAFQALAAIVRTRSSELPVADPLTASVPSGEGNNAVWALAEELAGQPRAWYPLIQLARLSIEEDHEAAMRRVAAACERENTGEALARGIEMLRVAGAPSDALGLGLGHWDATMTYREAAHQVVLAALDSGHFADARRVVDALERSGSGEHEQQAAQLKELVDSAEAESTTSS